MMESINTYAELKKMEGCIIGTSSYLLITEEMISEYHKSVSIVENSDFDYDKNDLIDFYIISIMPYLWKQIVDIRNVKMVINYGFDQIALINKVKIGEHIRLIASIESVKRILGVTKVVIDFNIEIKEREIRAVDGKAIFLYHFND